VGDEKGEVEAAGYHDSEEPREKEGAAMTLVDQVVHSDCRPVLEFGMVSYPRQHRVDASYMVHTFSETLPTSYLVA